MCWTILRIVCLFFRAYWFRFDWAYVTAYFRHFLNIFIEICCNYAATFIVLSKTLPSCHCIYKMTDSLFLCSITYTQQSVSWMYIVFYVLHRLLLLLKFLFLLLNILFMSTQNCVHVSFNCSFICAIYKEEFKYIFQLALNTLRWWITSV